MTITETVQRDIFSSLKIKISRLYHEKISKIGDRDRERQRQRENSLTREGAVSFIGRTFPFSAPRISTSASVSAVTAWRWWLP